MPRVFEGLVFVSYSQAYVQALGAEMPGMDETFAGQVNGLCGAAAAGVLFLTTGLHTGQVPFAVDLFVSEPPLPDGWEDVVEVSFLADERQLLLVGWGGGSVDEIALAAPGWYRVRYCGRGMDAARDTPYDDRPELDRYLLQFWPNPPRSDAVVRQQSAIAAYWHEYARQLPPPPTAEQRAAAQQAAEDSSRRERVAAAERLEQFRWGGREPSNRLRLLGGNVLGVARTDRDLLDSFEALDEKTQRAAARWLARRVFEMAELDRLDWVRPAPRCHGPRHRLPAPFTIWTGPTLVSAAVRPTPTSPWQCAMTHQHHPELSTDHPSRCPRCSARLNPIRWRPW